MFKQYANADDINCLQRQYFKGRNTEFYYITLEFDAQKKNK